MTTKELEHRYLGYTFLGRGHYKVSFEMYGVPRSATTTNTLAIDRINNDEIPKRAERYNYTYKEALRVLYDEVKRKNYGY